MKYSRIIFIAFLSAMSCVIACAQEHAPDTVQKTIVRMLHAGTRSFDRHIHEQRQVLRENVVFLHDSAYMYCDSAYFYEVDLILEAFGRVRLEQGDTLFIYGDYLFFDNNQQLAQIRNNVKMINIQQDSSVVTLYTDSLDYNLGTEIGYYFEKGRIVDAENELVSIYGQYSPQTKVATFQDSVCLTNPNFVLYSDTLVYSTETKVASIVGPSVIESDSGVIYSSRGWYNTMENTSLLLDRSQVLSGDKFLSGDSLLYDRNLGIGEAYGNVSIVDTAQKITLTGHYGYYEESTKYAFVTDSACALEYSQGDTLFIHADTLEMVSVDTTARVLRAFMGVRFYRTDVQGICDSMRFSTQDSVLRLFGNPVLWNENQQLFGDTIIMYMTDDGVEYVHVPTSAFVVQEVEADYYNQLGGNDLKAYFEGKNISRMDIDGNAESIFYPLEKDNTMIGLNHTTSAYLSIWFNEGQFNGMKIWPLSSNRMLPIPDLTPEEKTLKKFAWYEDVRPVDRYDIFRFYRSQASEELENIVSF